MLAIITCMFNACYKSVDIAMNLSSHPLMLYAAIVAIVYGAVFSLPEPELRQLAPQELRSWALDVGLRPVPRTFDALRAVVEKPDNPLTPEKIALGKRLFNDPILSREDSVSCASCHIIEDGGDDNFATAVGYHGLKNPKHLNSPTVLNAALARSQFWDGRAPDVEAQAAGPIQAPFEMNLTPEEVVAKLSRRPDYVAAFRRVFADDEPALTFANVRKAIGAYERTLLTESAYDRFLRGDDRALSEQALRGLNLFMQKGCKGCHAGMSLGGLSVQRFPLHRPITEVLDNAPFPFPNEGGFLGRDERRYFRVPLLRNVSRTAPYFHNGAVNELREAVRIMSKYQLGREFTPAQIDDVVAFLESLEGEPILGKIGSNQIFTAVQGGTARIDRAKRLIVPTWEGSNPQLQLEAYSRLF